MKRATEPSMHRKNSMAITVVIVGKDPVVSRAIESLLQTAGYATRFVGDPVTDRSRSVLAEAHVVLLVPGSSAASREKLLGSDTSRVIEAETLILELISETDASQLRQGHHHVRWPCSLEQLRRAIEAALNR
jgi:hypothetical protein